MTAMTQDRRSTTSWWLAGLGVAATVMVFFTPWALVLQVSMLGLLIYRLTRRPTKAEMVAVILAIAIILLSHVWLAAAGLSTAGMQSSFDGTSVPAGKP